MERPNTKPIKKDSLESLKRLLLEYLRPDTEAAVRLAILHELVEIRVDSVCKKSLHTESVAK